MKYTAYQHSPHVVKVETKERVICDCISDMATAEMIASALNMADATKRLRDALELAEATIQRLAPNGSRATQGTRDVISATLHNA